MTEHQLGELLLDIAFLLALSYLLAALLTRIRIPGILGALFIAMAIHYTPLGDQLLTPEIQIPLSLLAELWVLFLLFFIGIQIDPREMLGLGKEWKAEKSIEALKQCRDFRYNFKVVGLWE